MTEKFEKCPNCDEKLSGMFSNSIVEDEVIKGINGQIKLFKKELSLNILLKRKTNNLIETISINRI